MVSILALAICYVLVVSMGIVTSVRYEDCDPVVGSQIHRGDQVCECLFLNIAHNNFGL